MERKEAYFFRGQSKRETNVIHTENKEEWKKTAGEECYEGKRINLAGKEKAVESESHKSRSDLIRGKKLFTQKSRKTKSVSNKKGKRDEITKKGGTLK